MERDPKLPDDPLGFILECVRRGRIYWAYHVNMRLAGRFISRQSILRAAETYEIIETYPQGDFDNVKGTHQTGL